ncbi:MAG TPA: VWA domain-containing protein [Rhodocyclaceae bacterium]|nr:VWA domain-containing protein [Rhodocyclaceae bacterium]
MLSTFHFLRPAWFFALLPLAILLWQMWRQRLTSRSWQSVVDPRLLAHLLIGKSARRGPWALFAAGLAGLLSILALAGPAWQKLEQPVFRQQSALVILLDLSRSMDAADIKPSRLQRAELKLRDILDERKEGDTALVVYAAEPFVVSPLTSDAKTIASQVDSLSTDLMPAQGSRPDRAIDMARQLLEQGGAAHGGVLLITDRVDGTEPAALKNAIKHLIDAGHRLSILGVGTPEGAPIPDPDGGFFKSQDGNIVLPKLDDASLDAMARLGHGNYRRLSTDDSDFHALLSPFESVLDEQQSKKVEGMKSDQWRDEGPWLLLPLLLLGMLAFRRGYLIVMIAILLPLPHPAYAFDWNSLWRREDQRAQQAMAAKQPQQAAQLFHDPQWRAAANYRAGNYQAALDDLKDVGGAQAEYNRGNTLAQLGHFPEAVGAYDNALKLDPKLADAKYNRELLEKLMQKSPQQNQQNSNQSKSSDSPQSQNGQNPQDQSGANKSQSSPQESSQNKDGSDKNGQSKRDAQQQQADNQKSSDAAKQAQASQAQNQRQSASQNNNNNTEQKNDKQIGKDGQPQNGQPIAAQESTDNAKLNKADEQWLRRIPDDPGGLWRRKFLYQYKQQQTHESEKQPW